MRKRSDVRSGKLVLLTALIAAVALGLLFVVIVRHGISARAEPTALEEFIALRVRNLAIPAGAKRMTNPIPPGAEALHEGLAHFADHCAVCHGNNGSGDGEFGPGLYPKPPDLRAARTQSLSDGALFYIIENGVRFTGMPAFGTGTAESSRDTWKLVAFLRHLPSLTPDELEEMKTLNPVSPAELKERQAIEEFLQGGKKPPVAPHSHKR